jgi:hypothetical protein
MMLEVVDGGAGGVVDAEVVRFVVMVHVPSPP